MEWDYIISLNLINLKEMSLTDCHIRIRAEETTLALFYIKLSDSIKLTYLGTSIALFEGIPIEIKSLEKKATELNLIVLTDYIVLRNLYLINKLNNMEIEYLMRDLETLNVNEFYDTSPSWRYLYIKSKDGSIDRYIFYVETYSDLMIIKPIKEVDFDLVEELKSQDKLHHSGKFKI